MGVKSEIGWLNVTRGVVPQKGDVREDGRIYYANRWMTPETHARHTAAKSDKPGTECTHEGCGRLQFCKKLCRRHYQSTAQAEQRKRTPEKNEVRNRRVREWHQANKTRVYLVSGKRVGFAPQLTVTLMQHQAGRCAVCKLEFEDAGRGAKHMNRDHDHTTGKARGLLCAPCNKVLGYYEKDLKPRGVVLVPFDEYLSDTPVSQLEQAAK
jgi:hypothetical protein